VLHDAEVGVTLPFRQAQEDQTLSDNIILFRAPVMHLHIEPCRPIKRGDLLVVEHDGRLYSLGALFARLPDHVLDEIDALVPRSSQETWDLVVRRWPRLAKAATGGLATSSWEP
jgi:hypothetical protein